MAEEDTSSPPIEEPEESRRTPPVEEPSEQEARHTPLEEPGEQEARRPEPIIENGDNSPPIPSVRDEDSEFICVVDEPEKIVTAMESFITFRVFTTTSRADFDRHQYEVKRRYSDFEWLRQRLEEQHPTQLVPPLPQKHSIRRLELDQFEPDFLKCRAFLLQKFLSRICDHAVLREDKYFHCFITAKLHELLADDTRKTGGILNRIGSSLSSAATNYWVKDRPAEAIIMSDYSAALRDKMASLERIASRINKEQTECAREAHELSTIFDLWSHVEDSTLKRSLTIMAESSANWSNSLGEQTSNLPFGFVWPAHEFGLGCDSMDQLLKRRDAQQVAAEAVLEELRRKKDEMIAAETGAQSGGWFWSKSMTEEKGSQGTERSAKTVKLAARVAELQRNADWEDDRMTKMNEDVRTEYRRWRRGQQEELSKMLLQLARNHATYHQKCLETWSDAVERLNEMSNETE